MTKTSKEGRSPSGLPTAPPEIEVDLNSDLEADLKVDVRIGDASETPRPDGQPATPRPDGAPATPRPDGDLPAGNGDGSGDEESGSGTHDRPTLQADVEVLAEDLDLWREPEGTPPGAKRSTLPPVTFSMKHRELSEEERMAGGRPTDAPDGPAVEDQSNGDRPTREVTLEHAANKDLLDDPEGGARGLDLRDTFGSEFPGQKELPPVDLSLDDMGSDDDTEVRTANLLPSGQLSSRALLHLLATIGMKRESVTVVFEGEETALEATFADGQLQRVITTTGDDPYHQYLLDQGHITRMEYEIGMAMAQKQGRELVEMLLSTTVLDEAAVKKSRARHLRDSLLDIFAWGTGHYTCRPCPAFESGPGEIDALSVLWLGTCRHVPPARALEWLYLHSDLQISLVRLPEGAIERLELPPVAKQTLQDIPLETVPVEDWVNNCARQNRHDRYQATVALFLARDLGWLNIESS